jgi:hypothetical protein
LFVGAVGTKYHGVGGLNEKFILSQFWRLEVRKKSRHWLGGSFRDL